MSKSRNLYALIVGINDYQHVTKLGGCVNDATRVRDYLKAVTDDGDFNYHPVLLTDSKATRANIIENFKKHLTKAGKDDVALFYFSGHGAQEEADEVWAKHEADNALETVVCYDSRDEKGTPDLADKEQRYLINLVAQNNPHIVIIADSCHSGDNTRPSELKKRRLGDRAEIKADTEEAKARLSALSPMRTWDRFCFADKITPKMVQKANALEDIMPQGKHIAFGACRDHELAYELKGSGIFTSILLDVLKRSSGQVSYVDLHSRIKNTISGKYPQVPQVYASSGNAVDLQATFLGGASSQKPHFYNVSKNKKRRLGWMIDVGAIHGMPTAATGKELTINIVAHDDPSKVLTTATPTKVMPGYTLITLADENAVEETPYPATIDGLFLNPVNFYIAGVQKGLDAFNAYATKRAEDMARSNINMVTDLALADYMVVAKGVDEISYYIGVQMDEDDVLSDKSYPIKRPGDDLVDNVPLWKWRTQRCTGTDDQSLGALIGYMQHIARWEFLKRLENPTSELDPEDFFEVKFYQGKYKGRRLKEKKEVFPNDNGIIELEFPYTSKKGNPLNHLLIDIENVDESFTLYAAMPALFNEFDIYTDVLRGGSVEFQPEHKESAHKGQSLPFEMLPYIREFNYEYVPIFFKLIVSASDFQISSFAQKGLKPPKRDRSVGRGFSDFSIEISHVNEDDWATKTYEVRFKNPFYIKPPEHLT